MSGGVAAISALDWKRIQMLLSFGRWNGWWGPRPSPADVAYVCERLVAAGYRVADRMAAE